jgi:hypothetical protein
LKTQARLRVTKSEDAWFDLPGFIYWFIPNGQSMAAWGKKLFVHHAAIGVPGGTRAPASCQEIDFMMDIASERRYKIGGRL